MELTADASAVRQFLPYLDHIVLNEQELRVGRIDKKVRESAAPMRVPARLIMELLEDASELTKNPDLGLEYASWLNPRGFAAIKSGLGARRITG
jgi:hypothetical protein